jgi:hypothetical protein
MVISNLPTAETPFATLESNLRLIIEENLVGNSLRSWLGNYWVAMTPFIALFGGSVLFGLADIEASYREFTHLGFPEWSFYFLTIAKALGIVAVLTNKSQVLKDFAFSGFLFDLLLAVSSHTANHEIKFLLPLASLGVWALAFTADRRKFPARW